MRVTANSFPVPPGLPAMPLALELTQEEATKLKYIMAFFEMLPAHIHAYQDNRGLSPDNVPDREKISAFMAGLSGALNRAEIKWKGDAFK